MRKLRIADLRLQNSGRPEAFRRGATAQRGQSVVELALLLPLFLVVMFGMVEVARMWWTQHALTNAAREALRAATQSDLKCFGGFIPASDCHDECVWVKGREAARKNLEMVGLISDESVAQTVFEAETVIDANGKGVKRLKVEITYLYDSMLPFLPSLISGTATLNGLPALVARSTAACEP
jgi:hypothetical protein